MRNGSRKLRSVLLMVRPTALTGSAPAEASAPAQEGQPETGEHCPACGASMAADQEWCLDCGVARTGIQAPPDWRVGVAIMLAVVAIVVLITVILWP